VETLAMKRGLCGLSAEARDGDLEGSLGELLDARPDFIE